MGELAGTSIALRAKLFRGLADHSRLAILLALEEGPQTVGDIVSATGLTQSNASNHLACLRECGLVEWQREGRNVRYRSAQPALADLFAQADRLLGPTLDRIAACSNYEGTHVG